LACGKNIVHLGLPDTFDQSSYHDGVSAFTLVQFCDCSCLLCFSCDRSQFGPGRVRVVGITGTASRHHAVRRALLRTPTQLILSILRNYCSQPQYCANGPCFTTVMNEVLHVLFLRFPPIRTENVIDMKSTTTYDLVFVVRSEGVFARRGSPLGRLMPRKDNSWLDTGKWPQPPCVVSFVREIRAFCERRQGLG